MGGRGGSSGISNNVGMAVTAKGETTHYYFTTRNGTNYYQRGVSGTPEPTPLNMSAKEFRQRVERNGATVATISRAAKQKAEREYRADRKATSNFLNKEDASNKRMASGSRMSAKGNRARRRSR